MRSPFIQPPVATTLWKHLGILPILCSAAIVTLGIGTMLVLDAGEGASREKQLVAHYERRLRTARAELDAVRSRQAVAQAKLARQAAALAARSNWLGAVAANDAVRDTGLRLRGTNDAKTDVLASVEESLRRTERRQLGDMARLSLRMERQTQKLTKILKMHGITTQAAGGPLIALKGSTGFDERIAAFEASQAKYQAIRSMAERLPQGSPVPGRKISSRFGARRDPLNGRQAMHAGLDFGAPEGEPVRATAAAKVEFAGRRGGYGKLVILDHGNGITTRYGHLSRISVEKGQSVRRGQRIGRVGSTGRSTGPHLHYEVRRKGQARDPSHYVRLRRTLKSLM